MACGRRVFMDGEQTCFVTICEVHRTTFELHCMRRAIELQDLDENGDRAFCARAPSLTIADDLNLFGLCHYGRRFCQQHRSKSQERKM
ncbi:hypothetical protein PoB_000087100 [Plakobranchus ocellatus]|uniref:Uncharacterized protein n=1 Tax=Plakobranchus ocellatus TaxID=259542 RepID=A0AAV3XWD0_9GAST|nr:hypothetical protein PoB_000087100 [Plakobranchus ocellatus]